MFKLDLFVIASWGFAAGSPEAWSALARAEKLIRRRVILPQARA